MGTSPLTDPELALLESVRARCVAQLKMHPESRLARDILVLVDQVERQYRATPAGAQSVMRLLQQLDPPPDPPEPVD